MNSSQIREITGLLFPMVSSTCWKAAGMCWKVLEMQQMKILFNVYEINNSYFTGTDSFPVPAVILSDLCRFCIENQRKYNRVHRVIPSFRKGGYVDRAGTGSFMVKDVLANQLVSWSG